MVDSSNDVSRLHNKYSITLVTPSSYWLSLVISMLIMASMSHVWYGIGSSRDCTISCKGLWYINRFIIGILKGTTSIIVWKPLGLDTIIWSSCS